MELSEPERAKARYQAVLTSLLAPEQSAQLIVYDPLEARLHVGTTERGTVPVLAQVLLAAGRDDDMAALRRRMQPLLAALSPERPGDSGSRFYLRLIVVAADLEAAALWPALQELAAELPGAPAVQLFLVTSSGAVRSSASLRFSEVGAALRAQARVVPALQPEAAFAARCAEAVEQAKIRFDQAQQFSVSLQERRTPVTYALLGLHGALFAISYLWGGSEQSATLGRMGAAVPERILHGEWWRLLAATALHGGFLHLAFNSVALWSLGRLLEKLLGPARFLTLYVASGLFGSLLGVALAKVTHFALSVGASGAICGLLAACWAIGLRPREDVPVLIAQNLKRMAVVNLLLTAYVSTRPHVDWVAHLGGALGGAGLILSGLLRPTARVQGGAAPARDRAHLALGAISGALLLVSIGVALWRGQPWQLTHLQQVRRVPLVGTPLSIEVPRALGHGHPGSRSDGSGALLFDDPLETAVELTILTKAHGLALSTPEQRQHEAEAQWSLLARLAHREDPNTTIEQLTLDGLPAARTTRTGPGGAKAQLLTEIRPDYYVGIDVKVSPDTPPAMVPDLKTIMASIREQKP
jgi:membrane associated rhomboid family serine protease